jgi:hypothetical protein
MVDEFEGDIFQETAGRSDETTLETTEGEDLLAVEHHIVFSTTFNVPVLYFSACKQDGQPLPYKEILDLITCEVGSEDQWTFLTQEEHPVLGTPFYMLHPCQTAERMTLLLGGPQDNQLSSGKDVNNGNGGNSSRGAHYLLSWFSLIGPILRLPVPPEHFAAAVQGEVTEAVQGEVPEAVQGGVPEAVQGEVPALLPRIPSLDDVSPSALELIY